MLPYCHFGLRLLVSAVALDLVDCLKSVSSDSILQSGSLKIGLKLLASEQRVLVVEIESQLIMTLTELFCNRLAGLASSTLSSV